MPVGRWILVRGEGAPQASPCLPLGDRGFLAGDGVFETLRVYGETPFRLGAHLARLRRGLDAIALPIPWSDTQLREHVASLLAGRSRGSPDARLRISVSRGPGAPFEDAATEPTLLVTLEPFAADPPGAVEVVGSAFRRRPHPLHQVKSLSYAPALYLRREARRRGAWEALQWNDAGFLCEGSCTNVFLVAPDGVLRTPHPREGLLPGITRAEVLRIAGALGLPYIEGEVDAAAMDAASEAFLTSSLREIVPVRSFEGRALPDAPGPVTRRLQAAYREQVRMATGGTEGRKPDDVL